jgi:NADPH-dependent ferric siderophore reductase
MTDRELMQMALAGLERISAIDRCFSQRESIRLLRDRLAHPESEIKMFEQKTDLMNDEVLRVTAEGKFIWNQKADQMIAEGDYSANPALSYILKALRNSERIHASDISQERVDEMTKHRHEEKNCGTS